MCQYGGLVRGSNERVKTDAQINSVNDLEPFDCVARSSSRSLWSRWSTCVSLFDCIFVAIDGIVRLRVETEILSGLCLSRRMKITRT